MHEFIKEEFMEQEKIKVLVKLNENNEIIQIGSSIFINDTDFIEIDSGFGDKFSHAQSGYLDKSLTDEYGRFNYKFENKKLLQVTHLPYVAPPKEPTLDEILLESAVDTDYRLTMLEMGLN